MINIFKKILFISLSLLFTIFLVACGNKLSKEEIINKFVEKSKNIKNMDIVVNMDLERKTTLNKEGTHQNALYEVSVIFEPFSMKLNLSLSSLDNVETFIKDNYFYVKNSKTNEWVREDGKKVIPEFQKVINNFKLIYDGIKNNIKLIDLSEKDGNYIIETKDFKNILKEMNIDGLELKLISEASLRYTVDKKTFLPIDSDIIIKFDLNHGSKESIAINLKYSNINNVKEIILPMEVLEAKINNGDKI